MTVDVNFFYSFGGIGCENDIQGRFVNPFKIHRA